MKVNDKQVAGAHYQKGSIQHWDLMDEIDVGYLEGCATKYLTRWRDKNGLQDLLKAQHYIEKRIEQFTWGKGRSKGSAWSPNFNRFIYENEVGDNESVIIEKILFWQNIQDLKFANTKMNALIEDARVEGDATSAYVNQ